MKRCKTKYQSGNGDDSIYIDRYEMETDSILFTLIVMRWRQIQMTFNTF